MNRNTRQPVSIAVAAEAVINNPDAYDAETINAVRLEAIAWGLPGSIIEQLPEPTSPDVYTDAQFR